MLESPIQKLVWARASRLGMRLFRNNVGSAWMGSGAPRYLADGSIVLSQPRRVSFGLIKGSGDLIGWTPVTITPDMVGKTVAVFSSVECKRSSGGRTADDQLNWLEQVRCAGGFAVLVPSPEALERDLADYRIMIQP